MAEIFYHARINGINENKTALYSDNGVITHIGKDEEILLRSVSGDLRVDCGGRLLMNGYAVGGVHVVRRGRQLLAIPLQKCTREQEAAELLRSGDPVFSRYLVGEGLPGHLATERLKAEIDDISGNVVIFLENSRDCVLNAKAAALLEPFGSGALYEESTGVLKTADERTLERILDLWSAKDLEKMILAGASWYAEHGFTSLFSDDLGIGDSYEAVLDAFLRLDYQQKLPVRISEICYFRENETFAHFLDDGYTADIGGTHFRIGRYLADLSDPACEAGMELANMYNMGCLIIPDEEEDISWLEDIIYEGNPLHSALYAPEGLGSRQKKTAASLGLQVWSTAAYADENCRVIIHEGDDDIAALLNKASHISADDVLQILSAAGNEAMEREDLGCIREGCAADLILLDKERHIEAVFCGGQEIKDI